MARRLFNGRRFSEDGWPYVDEGSCTWVVVPGTNPPVHLQIQNGPPLDLLRAWAADWNAYIEPLRDADSACWTPGNSVATSNHPGGTAIDLNWESHDFQARGTLNTAQMAVMAEMENFYEDNVFWAGRWKSPVDEMHSQCGYGTYDQNADRPFPKVLDFIARKIRADGFSTFRRGGTTAPPPAPDTNAALDVLVRATGVTPAKAQQILVGVVNGLRDSQCNNVNRIAMWLAQIGHESAGFNATEEYQNGDESTDRWKYKGRTWIQITWQSNYAGLSKWAFGKGLIPTPTYFVDNPKKLAEIQYAGLGPAWYWTVARPQINSLCDRRDLVAVTQAINGGQNGAADRANRYERALALGDQLLVLTTPTTPGDDMALVPQEQWDAFYRAYMGEQPSLSPFRPPGPPPTGSAAQFVRWSNGGSDFQDKKDLAVLGHQPTLDLLKQIAVLPDPERQADAALARNVLAAAERAWAATTAPAPTTAAAPAAVDNSAALAAANAEIARLRDDNARLRAEAAVAAVSTAVVPVNGSAELEKTPGEITGDVVDSVTDYTRHLLAMDATERQGHLAALRALQPSNGTPA